MTKSFEQRKNVKKKPSMTLKERRQKKQEKKAAKEQHDISLM